MKKIFIAALFFPLFLFADSTSLSQDDFIEVQRIYNYTFSSFSSSNEVAVSLNSLDPSSVFSSYYNSVNGVKFSSDSRILRAPSYSYPVSTNKNSRNISFPVQGKTVFYPNYSCYSLFAFNRVLALYNSVISLYVAGYRGSGFRDIYLAPEGSNTRFGNVAINFYFPDIVSDILVSTNSTFSQILFDSLSSIDSNVSLLSSNLSSFRQSYQSVNLPVFDFPKYLESQVEMGSISQPDADSWQATFDQFSYDPMLQSAFAQAVQNTVDFNHQAERTLQTLQDSAQSNPSQLQDIGNSFNGSVEGAVKDYTRLSTNWQEKVKKDLQDWRSDVTNRLDHMFDENVPIDGGNDKPVYVSGANGGAVQIAGVVGLANDVTVGVSIQDPVEIDSTSFADTYVKLDSLKTSIDTFKDTFFDWAYDSNKIGNWFSFYRLFSGSVVTNIEAEVSLLSSISNILTSLTGHMTNNVFSISNAFHSVSNEYLLLSDYAHYIQSNGLKDLIDIMDDDTYSELKDELLGISSLDQADTYGRWWRYFTGLQTVNANSNYKLSNLFLGHEKTLKELQESSGSDSLLDKFQSLFESIPSPTDIMDKSGNLTNSIDGTGFFSLSQDVNSMSNAFNNVEQFFNRGSALPVSISFDLGFGNTPGVNASQPVVLPLDKYRGVMDLLHYGIAFSYCIVNLILLPKFLLILIHLFDRVWKGYDKKLSDAVQV